MRTPTSGHRLLAQQAAVGDSLATEQPQRKGLAGRMRWSLFVANNDIC
jgi:hypothetical protein